MKPGIYIILMCLLVSVFSLTLASPSCSADDDMDEVAVTVMPGRYTAVKGDAQRYRQHHWMKDGYAGGFKDIFFKHEKGDTTMSFEGATIPDENDVEAILSFDKEDVFSFKSDYRSFRKYYSGTGGVYAPFSTLSVNKFDQDLHMDIGHLTVELGKPLGESSDIGLVYERHEKAGTKSRLAWTGVTNGVTREIGPSWQRVDESTDSITLKGKTEVEGVTLKGEQRLDFTHDNSFREEKFLGTVSGSGTKIRRQEQIPQTDSYTTSLRGEKWMLDDKSFVAVAYRYNKLKNSELENLNEYNDLGSPFNYTSPKSAVNAFAENWYDSHTWVGHYVTSLLARLNFVTKFKAEAIGRRGSSTYPHDSNTGVPNGIINTTDESHVENNVYRTGENFSFQYSGIPRTSLYTDIDLEQTRNWISEERRSIAGESVADTAGENLSRETITQIQKTIWTLGGRVVPTSYFNMTAQIKHRLNDNDYDDISETVSSGTAKSAFMDDLKLPSNEVATRWTWKPFNWMQGAFRYQFIDKKYLSRAENLIQQKSQHLSNIFTYDLTLQPLDVFLLTMSYSRQDSKVSTPVTSMGVTGSMPGQTSNVDSWLLSSSYAPTDILTVINSFQYSQARNFNDFSNYTLGLPLGADYDQYDASLGLQWTPKKDITISPNYVYSNYRANPLVDVTDYSAHTVSLDFACNW